MDTVTNARKIEETLVVASVVDLDCSGNGRHFALSSPDLPINR